MKKILVILAVVLVVAVLALHIKDNWIPKFPTYEKQKAYAQKLYIDAGHVRELAFYAPTLWASRFIRIIFLSRAWHKSLNANLYLLKAYPKQAEEDIDVLRRIADSYYSLKKYNEARAWYEKLLVFFKGKYFKNPSYWEKEGLTEKQALTEELRYLVGVQESIAACYSGVGEYQKCIEAHEKTLELLPEAEGIDEWDRAGIFTGTFEKVGRMYKVIFKDYKKAFDIYERMKEQFSSNISTSSADIYIGDTYLAMGDVITAKKIYQDVIDTYKPKKSGVYNFAEERLRNLDKGEPIISTDGVMYEIKNGKVIVKPI